VLRRKFSPEDFEEAKRDAAEKLKRKNNISCVHCREYFYVLPINY